VHWRTITRDNMTSIYSGKAASRIADPDNAQRVYEWLLQETFDATGNHLLYEYAKDHPQLYTNDDPSLRSQEIFEQHRCATQLYMRRLSYGNLPEPLVDAQGNPVTYADGMTVGHLRDGRRYAFEVVFDYGDWDTPTTLPHPGPLPTEQQELFGDCSKDTGFIQPVHDGGRRGFVDGLRLGLHATYLVPSGHGSAFACARGRRAFASCNSAGCPAPRHARWRAAACRRETSGPFPTWGKRAF